MTDVLMPQMGESVTEGTVTRWLKRVGDRVERDEPLLEISTDKVDAEIPAPATGVLSEVLVTEGTTVAVATVLARISSADQAAPHSEEPAKSDVSPAPSSPAPEPAPTPPPAAPPASAPDASEPVTETPTPSAASQLEELRRTRSSPLVRRMAADHKVDLSSLRGTGIDGRVTRQDLQNYLAQGRPPAPEPGPRSPAPSVVVTPTPEPMALREEPLSLLQPRTAEQVVASHGESAHAVTVFEVDLTPVERLRAAHAHAYSERGISLTVLPFILRATADALRVHPSLTASVDGQRVLDHKDISIGVTVPLDRGQVVPVIRGADAKRVSELARELADLSERARTRRLRIEEVQQATFTILDAGGMGGLFRVPIIQQAQVALLSVGAVERRPFVIDDAIAIRSLAFLALSYDQRLIESSDADRFMADLKKGLAAFSEAAL
jgi:pyruvate dehydrogenase E2 component (dihydrolipoamide acetyltransferase)